MLNKFIQNKTGNMNAKTLFPFLLHAPQTNLICDENNYEKF